MIKKLSELLGIDVSIRTRQPEYAWARFAAYYYLSRRKRFSEPKIGKMFGYSAASVHHGIHEFMTKLEINDSMACEYWDKLKNIK